MAIKRVSDSYASGIQAFGGTRRPRPPRSPRQPSAHANSHIAALAEALAVEVGETLTKKPPQAVPEKTVEAEAPIPEAARPESATPGSSSPEAALGKLDASTERAIADVAADIGKLRQK